MKPDPNIAFGGDPPFGYDWPETQPIETHTSFPSWDSPTPEENGKFPWMLTMPLFAFVIIVMLIVF